MPKPLTFTKQELQAMQKRASAKFNVIGNLNSMIDNGTAAERIAAGKAKRAKQDSWTKREPNKANMKAAGFYNPDGKRIANIK